MKLVIASHNAGKVREIGELLAPLGLEAVSAAALALPEPEETGDSFEANAALKAEAAASAAGLAALADDSGLCVDGLGGAPGIYSARWAGPEKDFIAAMKRIEDALREHGIEPHGARASFVCVLALSRPGQEAAFFRGEVHGRLSFPPRGIHGFGYDPIFIADGHSLTFAEMQPQAKHAISHRARAFALLLKGLTADAS